MTFQSGDRVLVPWGLDELVGTVTDVFGPAPDPFVRVRVNPGGEDVVEVPIKASLLRLAPPAPSGTIEVTSVSLRDGRLMVGVTVDGAGIDRHVQVMTTREDAGALERELGPEDAPAELAAYALHIVSSMLESGTEVPDQYLLSHADALKVLRVAGARRQSG